MTDGFLVQMASVRVRIAASEAMKLVDGGVFETDCTGTFAGGFEVILRTEKRRKEQTAAEEKSEVRKPATMMSAIFARSGAGSCGARGSMTRFGTKKTASQRLRKETPGVKYAADAQSTVGDWRKKRAREMRVRRRSIEARGGGKVSPRERRRAATKDWILIKRKRETSCEKTVRRRDIFWAGGVVGETEARIWVCLIVV